jgi:hypothetical protein
MQTIFLITYLACIDASCTEERLQAGDLVVATLVESVLALAPCIREVEIQSIDVPEPPQATGAPSAQGR